MSKQIHFGFENCWPYLMDCQIFSNSPSMDFSSSSFYVPMDLNDRWNILDKLKLFNKVDTPFEIKSLIRRQLREKTIKHDKAVILRMQIQIFANQNDHEYAQRLELIKDGKARC